MSPENPEVVETQEDLEREMTIEELEQVIIDGQNTHQMLMQHIGHKIGEASDISHTIGRYMQLLEHKKLIAESENATQH